MKHVPTVARRELRSLFVSPVAYAVLSLFAVVAGFFFVLFVSAFNEQLMRLQQFQAFDQLEQLNLSDHLIAYFYQQVLGLLAFVVPGITMGLFVAEKQNGTQELLMTSPLTIWDVVLGKFAAAAAFVAILVALVGAYPALLFFYGDPEVGKTATGLLALLLVGWTFVAVGTFASSITRSQIVAVLITFVMLIGLMMLPVISMLGVLGAGGGAAAALAWLSPGEHFDPMLQGLVDTSDLAYFAVVIGSFLLLTKASVESVRWR